MNKTLQGNLPPDSNGEKKPGVCGLSQPGSTQSQATGYSVDQTASPFARPADKAQAERKPLFPLRDTAADQNKPLLSPRETQANPEERKPLFPQRDAQAKLGIYKPLFPKSDDAGGSVLGKNENKPLFPSQVEQPAGGFGTAAPKTIFGAQPTAATTGISTGATKVTDAEFIQLRDFLYTNSGIFIAENRKYLVENRLSTRLRELGLRNFGEYYNFLRFDNSRTEELNKLFEYMTTNETSFFRNQPQLDVFRDKVLMKVLDEQRDKGQKKLRIWSAGCSSGEEPYTLSMILYEVLKGEIDSWDIKITANDLSMAMLGVARRGLYSDYAIRTTPPEMLAKYFKKEGNQYRIEPKLSKMISFGQINLSSKVQLQKVERSQIIFCRNVIIYFDDEMKRSVIGAFYDNLLPGGYLIIGHSESLHSISRAFKLEHHAGSIVYLRQS